MNRAVQCTPIPFRGIGNRWLQEAPHRGANGVHWRVMRPGPGGASRARRMNPVKQEARIATEEAIRMSRETLTITDNRTGKTCEIPIKDGDFAGFSRAVVGDGERLAAHAD